MIYKVIKKQAASKEFDGACLLVSLVIILLEYILDFSQIFRVA